MKNASITLRLIFTLLALVLCLDISAEPTRPARLRDALQSLDSVIEHRSQYISRRHDRIDSIKLVLEQPSASRSRTRTLAALGMEYYDIDADSSIKYLQQSYDAAVNDMDSAAMAMAKINIAGVLIRRMLYSDAIAMLGTVDTTALERREKIYYLSNLSRAHLMSHSHMPGGIDRQEHKAKGLDALARLASHFNKDSREYKLALAQKDFLNSKSAVGLGELIDVFEHITTDYPGYAVVTGMLASYYKDSPAKRDEYLYYLTLSAKSDATKSNGEPASMVTLACELFKDNDKDRAYNYLKSSTEAINSSKSTLLSSELIEPISLINDTIRRRQDKIKMTYGIVALVIALLLALATYLYLRQRGNSARLQQRIDLLNESVASRELYINQLLEICSVYVEGLEDFNRLVGRKLKTGQAKDLYETIESGKMLQEQNERFFVVFDAAVLRIFPNFIEDLNKLLLSERRFENTKTEKLSPEQRIVAFMRLGVTDSTRISKFLGLSLNTVYTYRNRMKSRAIDRDNFDKNVQNIDKIG